MSRFVTRNLIREEQKYKMKDPVSTSNTMPKNWFIDMSRPDAAISLFISKLPEAVRELTKVKSEWFQYCFNKKSVTTKNGNKEKIKITIALKSLGVMARTNWKTNINSRTEAA